MSCFETEDEGFGEFRTNGQLTNIEIGPLAQVSHTPRFACIWKQSWWWFFAVVCSGRVVFHVGNNIFIVKLVQRENNIFIVHVGE